jgi:hypothetical protein
MKKKDYKLRNIMKEIRVKHFIGQEPEGMAADFMKEKDWKKFNKRVARAKKNGTYGKEVESVLLMSKELVFTKQHKFILDLDNIEKHKFKKL